MKKFPPLLKRALLTFAFAFAFVALCAAQYEDELEDIAGHWEVGAMAGPTAFFGALGGNRGKGEPFIKDFNTPVTRPLFGVFADYFQNSWLAFKLNVNYTTVDGADSLIKNTGDLERWRYYRNLSFRSRILEGSLSAEVYPVMIFDKNIEIHKFAPYVGLGVGLFHFNPKTMYDGQWVSLKPLHTEGEGFPGIDPATGNPFPKNYHLLQVYIPITFGCKLYFNNKWAISGGITFRHTFTAYIDDVHTVYIDPSLFDKYLPPAQAALAKQLYERSITPWKVKPGIARGFPYGANGKTDSYETIFITLSYRFGNGPKFYYGG